MPAEKGALLMLALTGVTARVFRSTTERLLLPLFATTARFRTVSTATPVGDVPTAMGAPLMLGGEVFRSISVMELAPLLATTAMPVAVFTATAPGRGFVPGMMRVTTDGAVTERSEERRVGKECRSRWSP